VLFAWQATVSQDRLRSHLRKAEGGNGVDFDFVSASTPTPATKVTVHLKGKDGSAIETAGTATVWTLESSDGLGANTPGDPTMISPKKSTLASFSDGTVLDVPSNAYVIVQAELA
jgi:hypothetical protein